MELQSSSKPAPNEMPTTATKKLLKAFKNKIIHNYIVIMRTLLEYTKTSSVTYDGIHRVWLLLDKDNNHIDTIITPED